MSRFPRPEGAIEDYATLKKWQVLWHVYGILRPFMSEPHTVVRPPYKDDGSIRFDTRSSSGGFREGHFASDGNMQPGHSHNDNYWFCSEKEAVAARDYLTAQWDASPELKEAELERRREERETDRLIERELVAY